MEGVGAGGGPKAVAGSTGAWPPADLEHVERCPVCGSSSRRLLRDGLRDVVYGTAPGQWAFQQCGDCSCAYLDPRPDAASIGRAYAEFYTHEAAPAQPIARSRGLRQAIRNGYINSRLSTRLSPAVPFAAWIASLFPSRKREYDFALRGLPPLGASGGSVLDVGCGNGDFLVTAAALGWEAWGVEADSVAAAHARTRGIRIVGGGIEDADLPQNRFDVVTLCHAIEHFADPVAALRKVAATLKPGGRLWLATPNLESEALAAFGDQWIGFDVPRHLVLFNRRSLLRLLDAAGFAKAVELHRGRSARGDFMLSWKASIGVKPFDRYEGELPGRFRNLAKRTDRRFTRDPRGEQELVVTAAK